MEEIVFLFVRLTDNKKLEFRVEKAENVKLEDKPYCLTRDTVETFLKIVEITPTLDMIEDINHWMQLSAEFQRIKRINII